MAVTDFQADTPTPEATPEGAASVYASTSPDLVSGLGSQFAAVPAMAISRAAERGAYADASALDRSFGRGGTADTPAGDQLIHEPLIPADDVNKAFGPVGPDGKQVAITDRPMSAGLAKVIARQKQDELDRNALWARYANNHGGLVNFGVSTAAFMLDPLNVGSLFVPGIGEEAILARAGQMGLEGVAARTAARLGAGATAGAAQMAPVVALKYGLGTGEASDYDLRSAFKDMAFGAAFGAVAHAGMGGLREAGVLKPDELMRAHGAVDMGPQPDLGPQPTTVVDPQDLEAVQNATLDQRQAAMNASVAQTIDGREVDVSPIIPTREPDPTGDLLTIPPGVSDDLSRRAVALSQDGAAEPSAALEEAAVQRAPQEVQNALFAEPAQTGIPDAADDGRSAGRLAGQAGQPADAGGRLRAPGEAGNAASSVASADATGGSGPAGGRVFYRGSSIAVRHELAEAADLVTSHTADFGVNPAFPAELQPRDRAAAPARAQVSRIATNLQPERLGPSPEANFGTPIVGPDNVVESGNGRTMALRQAYAAAGDRAAAYRAYLESLGHDTSSFKEPILVARRLTEMTPEERAAFAHATASSEAQRLGTRETALSDARMITPDVSQYLRTGDVGSSTNRDFARTFVAKLPPGEAAGMMAGDGSLSAAGVSRLRAAVTARAYGDESVIGRAFEHRDSNIKNLATALTNSAPDWIKMREAVERGEIPASEDITGDVMRTVQTVMRARDDGERMSDVFRQHDMFADGLPSRVTRLFFKGDDFGRFYSAGVIGDNLSTYARDIVTGAARGRDMFGNAAPGARDVLGGLIDRNRARADALEEGAPLLTASDVAQRQAQIAKDGYAPGIPQSEFDATTERLYGPKVAEPTAKAAPEPKVDPKTGKTVDPEMAALESRVLSSPKLTDVDRAEIATANDGVAQAAARGDAYALAGDMLARGEGSEPVAPSSDAIGASDVLRRAVAKVMPDASDDVVLASIRKIEDRDDWLGNAMRELIGEAEEKPAPPRMEQSLEDALREIIGAAKEPSVSRAEPTLDDEMRKLIGSGSEPVGAEPRHQVFRAGDVKIGEAPDDAYHTSDGYVGETFDHSMSFLKNGDKIDATIHDIHDKDGNALDRPLTRIEEHKLKKEVRGYLEDQAEQETEGARWDSLTPAEQQAELDAAEREKQTADSAKGDEIRMAVEEALAAGWRPEPTASSAYNWWKAPEAVKAFASPKSVGKIEALLRQRGFLPKLDLLASLRRSPEELTAATDQAAQDVAAMARRDAPEEIQDGIRQLVDLAAQPGHNHVQMPVGTTSDWLATTAAEHGLKIDGFDHLVDTSAIRHMLKRHSGADEAARGGLPLTKEDIAALPEVLASPDKIAFGATDPRGKPLVVYIKKMADGSTLLTEEVRARNLSVSSMRRYPATIDILKDVDLYVRNDGGAPLKVIDVPTDVKALEPHPDVLGRSRLASAPAGDAADPQSKADLTVRNNRTGAAVQAQDVAPLADMLKRFDTSGDAAADPLARATRMVIGDRLNRLIGDMKVFTVGPEEMRTLTASRLSLATGYEAAGFYDRAGGHIVVLDDVARNPAEMSQLLVHEGLHGAFMETIENSDVARNVVDHLRATAEAAHVANSGAALDHYGLTNAHEFVSEAFSNPEFQRFLASVPADERIAQAFGLDSTTGRTLWDVFVSAVRKILGLAPDQHSLLDAAMRVGHLLEERRAEMELRPSASDVYPAVRAADPISRIEQSVADRGHLTPEEARTLIKEVANRAEQMRQSGEADPYVAAARELAEKVKANARLDKLDALRNAEARTQIMSRIDQAGGMLSAAEQLRSMLHGTYKGGLHSAQSQFRGLASTWQAALSHKLHALGMEKVAISGALDEDIAKELWAKNAGGGEGSGNKLAKQAADAIHPVLEEIKSRLNALGARIGDATDYVSTTRHDPYKMRRAAGSGRNTPEEAFRAWWGDTQPLLSAKTFDGIVPRDGETLQQARDRFGRNVFDALVSGVHMTADGVSGIKFDPDGGARSGPAFEGSRNVAKKVSQDRTLFWKDGAAWNSYVQRYGAQTSLTEGVMRTITQASKQIALMERFGTNPMANLNLVERAIGERDRGDFEGLKRFQGHMNGVRNVMAYLDGSANIPANADWAAIGNNIRTYYSVADLGGVGVTHFASIWPTVSSEMRHHGIGRLQALGNIVSALVQRKGSAERQEILSDLGAYADGLSRDMAANWQPDSPQMGRMSSMANTFMKYTGIHFVFDHTQAAVRSMLSHNLARNLGKAFADLEPHLRGMLSSYGLGEPEWNLMRSVGDIKTENGRAYFTPRDALRIDPAMIEQHLRETGQLDPTQGSLDIPGAAASPVDAATAKYAQSLADKLGSYFSDTAAHSTVTAGARERAMLLGGSHAGTWGGEAMRFLTQFKMWPVAAYDQLLRREIQMSTSKADAAWGIGSMMALSAASGYFRMSVNDVALGHPIRDPLEWKTALAGLAQGGGLGILGDFLFGEVNRMGGGLIDVAGGPVVTEGARSHDDRLHVRRRCPDRRSGAVSAEPRRTDLGNLWWHGAVRSALTSARRWNGGRRSGGGSA